MENLQKDTTKRGRFINPFTDFGFKKIFGSEPNKEKIFRKVFQIAEYEKLNSEERQAYEHSLKYYRDLKNSLATAELDDYKKAEEKLIPIIEEERRQKEKTKYKLARKMKKYEEPIEEITKKTELAKEEIEKL